MQSVQFDHTFNQSNEYRKLMMTQDDKSKHVKVVDIENPLSDEDRDVVGENLFTSEPDDGEPE